MDEAAAETEEEQEEELLELEPELEIEIEIEVGLPLLLQTLQRYIGRRLGMGGNPCQTTSKWK
jgi:hypothetical protein